MPKAILIQDRFFSAASDLRGHFEERFADPHSADPQRFVWDYWHVPGQYTALRTPAYHFFPEPLYRELHEAIVKWGRQNLGCHDISPPWLSCYVEGCGQEFHGDLPHGPWAFVYSLTPWKKRKFSGGETFLLEERMLDYWQNLDRFQGLEEGEILKLVAPEMNRLTVFDPRIPHGVRKVRGVSDPREGRLVIHGWFVQPRPYIEGSLSKAALTSIIKQVTEELPGDLIDEAQIRGIACARFKVRRGEIEGVKLVSETLRSTRAGIPGAETEVVRRMLKALRGAGVPQRLKGSGSSTVTLPFVFEP